MSWGVDKAPVSLTFLLSQQLCQQSSGLELLNFTFLTLSSLPSNLIGELLRISLRD